MHRNTAKSDKRVADKHAVRAGTATEQQRNRVSFRAASVFALLTAILQVLVIKTCTRDYNAMMAMLRGMQAFDPRSFAEVPEQFKRGLACHEHWNLVATERTQELIAARLAEIAREGWVLQPHTNAEFAAFFAALAPIVEAILLLNMVCENFHVFSVFALLFFV